MIVSTLCLSGLLYGLYAAHTPQDESPVRLGYAHAALEVGEPELVMRQTLAHVEGDAEVEARRSLARLYERDWRLAAAQAELEQAAALCGACGPVALDLARVLLKRGDTCAAREQAEVAADKADAAQRGDALRLQGDVAKAAGRYPEATQFYAKARGLAANHDDVARIAAAECDLFQLERRLAPARQRCEQALSRQTIGHPERPATLKTLGLIYYFGGEPKRALGLHTRAQEGFAALSNTFEANWLREFAIDDEAAGVEDGDEAAALLAPLIRELQGLAARLLSGPETVWWRVSDCQLRLADLLRRARRFPEAEAAVQQGLKAFEQRPAGWQQIPDYATVFELAGLVAKDQGKLDESVAHLARSLEILEGIVGVSVDASYLKEEIAALRAEAGKVESDDSAGQVVVSQL